MARIEESEVVSTRFWKRVDKLSDEMGLESRYVHRIIFLMLFLQILPSDHELHGLLENNLDKRHFPNGFRLFGSSWLLSLAGINTERVVVIAEIHRVVAKLLGHDIEANALDRVGDPNAINYLLSVIADLVEQERNNSLLIKIFDYGFMRKLSSVKSGVLSSELYLADLATLWLNKTSSGVGDYCGYSGQFAIRASQRLNRPTHCVLGDQYAMDLELSMRLLIHGIPHHFIRQTNNPEFISSLAHSQAEVLLLTPPVIRSRGKHLSEREPRAAIHIAQELICSADNYRMALLAIPKTEAIKTGWQREIRQALLKSGQLLAVIDLPKSATPTAMSCWLIRGKADLKDGNEGKVLFIDADALSHLHHDEDSYGGLEFIAKLILLSLGDRRVMVSGSTSEEYPSGLLGSIFRREFHDGYHDVPGLCSRLQVGDVIDNGCKLVAKEYLASIREDSWLSGFDLRALQACLDTAESSGSVLYVIGNNGEGKSLLLKEFAGRSIKSGRKTVAIALGASDRFPSKRSVPADNYIYLGAKTSSSSVDLTKTAVDAGQWMLKIHSDPIRNMILNRVTAIIGFSAEHFLIPKKKAGAARAYDSFINGVVRMDSISSDDIQLLAQIEGSPTAASQYKLGLRKNEVEDAIIPFDELSSGEQQIILLAAKMVAHAEAGALFLIDEPEISLHVSWQRAIPLVLSTIAQEFQVDILVATHSPVLVASAVSDRDYCFTASDRAVTPVDRNDCQSVDTVLFEGFRTHTSNNRNIHERCAVLVAACIDLVNQDEFAEKDADELFAKLSDMQNIVEVGERVLGKNGGSAQTDLELISKSKSAIQEMIQFRKSDKGEVL